MTLLLDRGANERRWDLFVMNTYFQLWSADIYSQSLFFSFSETLTLTIQDTDGNTVLQSSNAIP
jgi:hypothetical protein